MNQDINRKIKELYESTPPGVGVGFGTKIKNGEYTEENGFVFTVEKKIPSIELSVDEHLPTEVVIGNVVYKTDVLEVGKIELMQFCNPNVPNINNNCYGWWTIPPQNRQQFRPLRGGISLTSDSQIGGVGTLGFLAQDIATNGLVGVTNSHVVVGDFTYTSQRNPAGTLQNEIFDRAYQPGEPVPVPSSWAVGRVIRYVPVYKNTSGLYNQVDGALISVDASSVDALSYRIFGLSGTTPMPFATTLEINNLLGNLTLASSGRSSGVKQGPNCGLRANSINWTGLVGGASMVSQGAPFYADYNNCISFTRLSPNCAYPIIQGDSGSALVAQIGGVDKIVGLCFAGSPYFGLAARIDQVAAQLGIKAWIGDGTVPPIINPNSFKFVTQNGLSSQKTITCNSKTLWQVGLTNQLYTC